MEEKRCNEDLVEHMDAFLKPMHDWESELLDVAEALLVKLDIYQERIQKVSKAYAILLASVWEDQIFNDDDFVYVFGDGLIGLPYWQP
ncbi:hypothetical protein GOP47_0010680 [Adiantum capillus-veneris]|uniref:Uncharacterized protein n=1 Tax=Adiantum capillus-veneris TaxID=13818 RepID=A0A9D4UVD8_ADICA|nr:hypothetical protein GOP47_0010680 [Adiantum capillus-veneris]